MKLAFAASLIFVASMMVVAPAAADDKDIGKQIDDELVATHLLIVADGVNRQLQSIVDDIGQAAGFARGGLTVRLINSPRIGIHATSGRYLYVTSGLLDVMENRDELAGLVAHTVDHLLHEDMVKRHKSRKRKKAFGTAGSMLLVAAVGAYDYSVAGSYAGPAIVNNAFWASAAMAHRLGPSLSQAYIQALATGYKEDRELRADRNAQRYLASAGYDPRALRHALETLRDVRDDRTIPPAHLGSALFSATPGLDNRISAVSGGAGR